MTTKTEPTALSDGELAEVDGGGASVRKVQKSGELDASERLAPGQEQIVMSGGSTMYEGLTDQPKK